MKACVTGGSGFIGNSLIKALVKHEVNIISVTRKKLAKNGLVDYFHVDLSEREAPLESLLHNVSCIYNCAGEIKNKKLMHALHVDGTTRLLDEVAKKIQVFKQPIHWVQLSSCGSYGSPIKADQSRVITEDSKCNPVGEYEVTKTLADELIIDFAKKQPLFTYTILRPTAVIGESMPNNSVRALVKMVEKGLFFYVASKNSITSYIHVDDVVDALILCGTDPRAINQVFNISNDCELYEIIEIIREKSPNIKAPFCVPEKLVRLVSFLTKPFQSMLTQSRIDALVSQTIYPSTKIFNTLNFTPKHAIPEAIVEMFCKETQF